jgi:2-amino-4-hydroxy-6-hydroxymethyldihydropteridine diphosphokinase
MPRMDDQPVSVYVGLGSNLAPDRHLPLAVRALGQAFGALECSHAYRNPAVGFDGPEFVNLVVRFETGESLPAVVGRLVAIEAELGKDFTAARFASKAVDLDLLLFGRCVFANDRFAVPRATLADEPYHLRPLAELAPHETHPVDGGSFGNLWRACAAQAPPMRRVALASPPDRQRCELAIDDLRLDARLGVGEDERANPQAISVSARIRWPTLPLTCTDDEVAGTLSYSDLCRAWEALVADTRFRTLEYLAARCLDEAERMVARHVPRGRAAIRVTVRKVNPPNPRLAGGAAVVLEST